MERLTSLARKKRMETSPLGSFGASIEANGLKVLAFLIFFASLNATKINGMNLLHRPYDTLLRPEINLDRCYELAFWAEAGVRPARGYNEDDAIVNPLAIWQCNQDALAMLEGFPDGSQQSQLLTALNASDDGVRGHACLNGKLNLDFGGAFAARWYFLPHAWITALLPVYKVNLSDVTIADLTQKITAADMRVKHQLIQQLNRIVAQLGNNFSLDGWKRAGFGDLNLLCEFLFNFPQERPLLKNVEINGRCGFTLPTGKRADEDKLFAFPFGYDGAVGILYGGGLNVMLGSQFKAGFDVQLLHLFGNTRLRRIKTAFDQTDLLLLAKAEAYKDYGLTQRFNLFVQGYHLLGSGLSLLVGYQFLKHGDDHLALNECAFSSSIANSATSLEEWIVHSVEFNLHYDFAQHCPDSWAAPQVSLFSRLPFGGKRAVAFTTVGVMIAVDF